MTDRVAAGAPADEPILAPLGDSALTIRLGTEIDEPTRLRIRSVVRALETLEPGGVLDVVPGFTTVTLHYDPVVLPWEVIRGRVHAVLRSAALPDADDGRLVRIPVCYGGEFGPDLDGVAARATLAAEQVIALHCAPVYRVHLIGFLPGFAYLGGLDPRIATPRRATPRDRVPGGSVGIAGAQTGIYPFESPGGWQLIGRSPVTFFDPARTPPTLLAPGDRVRFEAIDRAAFDLARAAAT